MEDFTPTWQSWRRGLDYYDEDVLNWLWVDVLLRNRPVARSRWTISATHSTRR